MNIKSIMSGWVERREGRFWDSFQTDHIPTVIQLFSCPINSTCPFQQHIKTLADTNMQRGNQFPPPLAFVVQRIVFTFSRSAQEHDIYEFAESFVFRLFVDQKTLYSSLIISMQTVSTPLAPIRICEFCKACYVGDGCPGCGARHFRLSGLGEAEAGRQFFMDLNDGLYIAPLQCFGVTLQGPREVTPHKPLRIWCHLEGQQDQSAQ